MNILPGAGRKWKTHRPKDEGYECIMVSPPRKYLLKSKRRPAKFTGTIYVIPFSKP